MTVRTAARRLTQRNAYRIPKGTAVPGLQLEHLRARGGRGKPQALTRPPTVPIRELDLPGHELVLGVEHAGDARGYLLTTLWPHHVINEVVGGKPIVVSLCMKCFSGMAFDPLVDGIQLEFGVWGSYLGALVIRDDQTGTLWAHLTGEGLIGPMAGRRLTTLPVEVTTLDRWTERHPESGTPDPRVMVGPAPARRRGSAGKRMAVYQEDGRLHPQAWVLGVSVDGHARGYVLDPDRPGPPIYQDRVAGIPVALLAPVGAWPLVYDRRTPTGVVDLLPNGDEFVDASGTRWTDRGRAVDGPLAGTELTVVPSRIVEWFAWVAYYPKTDVVHPVPETGRRDIGQVKWT